MAIDVNIPSQVKNYANLAAFPVTGTLKTIFIAEDTNKTYRWTGSAYVEISATAASTWGAIGGTLSNQTDLQNALNAKQDTLVSATNIKTINGTTLLGSGDLVVGGSSAIAIGTTAITSGTVGRVLFEGTGNVVQESANLFWDNTNGRLGIGTSTPSVALDILTTSSTGLKIVQSSATNSNGLFVDYSITGGGNAASQSIFRVTNSGNSSRLIASFADLLTISNVGNLSTSGLIATTNVNSNSINTLGGITMSGSTNPTLTATYSGASNSPAVTISQTFSGGAGGTAGIIRVDNRGANPYIYLHNNTTNPFLINANGNILVNTTTDAGFKLDVNGTARVVTKVVTPILEGVSSGRVDLKYGFGTSTPSSNILSVGYAGEPAILIGSGTTQNSSMIQMNSTTQGFLPPRMTTTQKNAIASPATGLMVYDTTLNLISVYNGTIWITL